MPHAIMSPCAAQMAPDQEHPFYVIGNWKMTGCLTSAQNFVAALPLLPPFVRGMMAFPCVFWHVIRQDLNAKGYDLCAQDCSGYIQGPWTGQISAGMAAEAGCTHSLVGHSERRAWETHHDIEEKTRRLQEHGLQPIICVSSLKQALDLTHTSSFSHQASIKGLLPWIAYEPAVGALAPPDQAFQDLSSLRDLFPHTKILYGGAVNAQTAAHLVPACHGFLAGRSSWHMDSWHALLEVVTQAASSHQKDETINHQQNTLP